jgi:hypothetical protein
VEANMNVTRRRVNVIVVVVILLVAAGLLLPAVKKVHMAAEKMKCQNNLKQLGMAIFNFEDSNGYRVQGTFPNAELMPEDRMSWCVALLPFIDADPTHGMTKKDKAWNDPANELLKMRWSTFVCPARPDYMTSQQTSYLGMAGLGEDAATLTTNDPRSGLFGYDRKVRKEDIKDGTANTISLLESRTGGPWAQGGPGSVRGLVTSQQPYFGELQPFGSWIVKSRWPTHPPEMTTQALMGDGSVRYFARETSPELLEALATINGGESVKE